MIIVGYLNNLLLCRAEHLVKEQCDLKEGCLAIAHHLMVTVFIAQTAVYHKAITDQAAGARKNAEKRNERSRIKVVNKEDSYLDFY